MVHYQNYHECYKTICMYLCKIENNIRYPVFLLMVKDQGSTEHFTWPCSCKMNTIKIVELLMSYKFTYERACGENWSQSIRVVKFYLHNTFLYTIHW